MDVGPKKNCRRRAGSELMENGRRAGGP